MKIIKIVIPILLVGVCLKVGYHWWQENNAIHISKATIFKTEINARPGMHPGLSAIYIDLSIPLSRTLGKLKFSLNRAEAVGAIPKKFSGGGQPEFSVIDLDKVAWKNGDIIAWEAIAVIPGTLRLKIWRKEDNLWTVVGESPIENADMGYNKFLLEPPLKISKGDYLGFYNPVSRSDFATLASKVYRRGRDEPSQGKLYIKDVDARGSFSEKELVRDGYGNFSFRALYSSKELFSSLLRPLPGRAMYRFESPYQEFLVDEQVELTIESIGEAKAFLYPFMSIPFTKDIYIRLEYGSKMPISTVRVVPGARRWW